MKSKSKRNRYGVRRIDADIGDGVSFGVIDYRTNEYVAEYERRGTAERDRDIRNGRSFGPLPSGGSDNR